MAYEILIQATNIYSVYSIVAGALFDSPDVLIGSLSRVKRLYEQVAKTLIHYLSTRMIYNVSFEGEKPVDFYNNRGTSLVIDNDLNALSCSVGSFNDMLTSYILINLEGNIEYYTNALYAAINLPQFADRVYLSQKPGCDAKLDRGEGPTVTLGGTFTKVNFQCDDVLVPPANRSTFSVTVDDTYALGANGTLTYQCGSETMIQWRA